MNELITQLADLQPVLAQLGGGDGLGEALGKIVNLLQAIAFVLAVAALIVSALMFSQGRVESALYGVAAAGILALSAVIVDFLYDAVGAKDEIEIDF